MIDATPYDNLVDLIRKLNHDVRAPLGSIISTSEMLSEGSYDPLTTKQARANDRIQRNSQRVLVILNDFSTYVKAQSGQLDLYPKPFNPRGDLNEWVTQVMPTAEKKGLTIRVTTQDAVPERLVGDSAVLSRAFLPVLWNAVIFSSQGEVHVISDWREELGWILTIQDAGPGIPEKNVPHLFEPFWRGEERPQTVTAGVGLGLALAFVISALVKGRVCLEKTSAQGSIFRFELPLSLAAAPKESAPSSAESSG